MIFSFIELISKWIVFNELYFCRAFWEKRMKKKLKCEVFMMLVEFGESEKN